LSKCVIGSPHSPIDLYLVDRRGTEFTIAEGVVQSYYSAGSFFGLDDGRLSSQFAGELRLTSREAMTLAAETLQRLIKSGNPLTNATARVQSAGSNGGKAIPFYRVVWQNTNQHLATIAKVEVDGRTGALLGLQLLDWGFLDPTFAREIKAKTYTPDPAVTAANKQLGKRVLPYPTTSQAAQVIHNWLDFCRRLGVETGENTNLAQIDWERSLICTDKTISASTPVCRITFTNGTLFEAVDGLVFRDFCSDAFFMGDYLRRPKAEWDNIQGTVTQRWEDLARSLEVRLSERLGVPKSVFEHAKFSRRNRGADLGEKGLTRTVVEWVKYDNPGYPVDAQSLPALFAAEFDLRTGTVKWISFYDASVLGWKEPRNVR
jgi:hypothetical protein